MVFIEQFFILMLFCKVYIYKIVIIYFSDGINAHATNSNNFSETPMKTEPDEGDPLQLDLTDKILGTPWQPYIDETSSVLAKAKCSSEYSDAVSSSPSTSKSMKLERLPHLTPQSSDKTNHSSHNPGLSTAAASNSFIMLGNCKNSPVRPISVGTVSNCSFDTVSNCSFDTVPSTKKSMLTKSKVTIVDIPDDDKWINQQKSVEFSDLRAAELKIFQLSMLIAKQKKEIAIYSELLQNRLKKQSRLPGKALNKSLSRYFSPSQIQFLTTENFSNWSKYDYLKALKLFRLNKEIYKTITAEWHFPLPKFEQLMRSSVYQNWKIDQYNTCPTMYSNLKTARNYDFANESHNNKDDTNTDIAVEAISDLRELVNNDNHNENFSECDSGVDNKTMDVIPRTIYKSLDTNSPTPLNMQAREKRKIPSEGVYLNILKRRRESDDSLTVNESLPSLATLKLLPTARPDYDTAAPTMVPTSAFTAAPTNVPTSAFTFAPTTAPTSASTVAPTTAPISAFTVSPAVAMHCAPTIAPNIILNYAPTADITFASTVEPTAGSTSLSAAPTTAPTATLTAAPTIAPNSTPTVAPTTAPTATPTVAPTTAPTLTPTVAPTTAPTSTSSDAPTTALTFTSTAAPTTAQTSTTTVAPISATTSYSTVTQIANTSVTTDPNSPLASLKLSLKKVVLKRIRSPIRVQRFTKHVEATSPLAKFVSTETLKLPTHDMSAASTAPPTPMSAASTAPPTPMSAASTAPPTPMSAASTASPTIMSAASTASPTPMSAASTATRTPMSAASSASPTPMSAAATATQISMSAASSSPPTPMSAAATATPTPLLTKIKLTPLHLTTASSTHYAMAGSSKILLLKKFIEKKNDGHT